MEALLEQIKVYADTAHGEQLRKYSPDRYIVHPVRVMETCKQYTNSLPVLAAALLHDVLEDTPVTSDELFQYLLTVMNREDATQTLQLVTALTDTYTKANYPRLNRRNRKTKEAARLAATSAMAQTIKYADILDNSKEIAAQDADFAPVYLRENKILLDKMKDGHPELRRRALETVGKELAK